MNPSVTVNNVNTNNLVDLESSNLSAQDNMIVKIAKTIFSSIKSVFYFTLAVGLFPVHFIAPHFYFNVTGYCDPEKKSAKPPVSSINSKNPPVSTDPNIQAVTQKPPIVNIAIPSNNTQGKDQNRPAGSDAANPTQVVNIEPQASSAIPAKAALYTLLPLSIGLFAKDWILGFFTSTEADKPSIQKDSSDFSDVVNNKNSSSPVFIPEKPNINEEPLPSLIQPESLPKEKQKDTIYDLYNSFFDNQNTSPYESESYLPPSELDFQQKPILPFGPQQLVPVTNQSLLPPPLAIDAPLVPQAESSLTDSVVEGIGGLAGGLVIGWGLIQLWNYTMGKPSKAPLDVTLKPSDITSLSVLPKAKTREDLKQNVHAVLSQIDSNTVVDALGQVLYSYVATSGRPHSNDKAEDMIGDIRTKISTKLNALEEETLEKRVEAITSLLHDELTLAPVKYSLEVGATPEDQLAIDLQDLLISNDPRKKDAPDKVAFTFVNNFSTYLSKQKKLFTPEGNVGNKTEVLTPETAHQAMMEKIKEVCKDWDPHNLEFESKRIVNELLTYTTEPAALEKTKETFKETIRTTVGMAFRNQWSNEGIASEIKKEFKKLFNVSPSDEQVLNIIKEHRDNSIDQTSFENTVSTFTNAIYSSMMSLKTSPVPKPAPEKQPSVDVEEGQKIIQTTDGPVDPSTLSVAPQPPQDFSTDEKPNPLTTSGLNRALEGINVSGIGPRIEVPNQPEQSSTVNQLMDSESMQFSKTGNGQPLTDSFLNNLLKDQPENSINQASLPAPLTLEQSELEPFAQEEKSKSVFNKVDFEKTILKTISQGRTKQTDIGRVASRLQTQFAKYFKTTKNYTEVISILETELREKRSLNLVELTEHIYNTLMDLEKTPVNTGQTDNNLPDLSKSTIGAMNDPSNLPPPMDQEPTDHLPPQKEDDPNAPAASDSYMFQPTYLKGQRLDPVQDVPSLPTGGLNNPTSNSEPQGGLLAELTRGKTLKATTPPDPQAKKQAQKSEEELKLENLRKQVSDEQDENNVWNSLILNSKGEPTEQNGTIVIKGRYNNSPTIAQQETPENDTLSPSDQKKLDAITNPQKKLLEEERDKEIKVHETKFNKDIQTAEVSKKYKTKEARKEAIEQLNQEKTSKTAELRENCKTAIKKMIEEETLKFKETLKNQNKIEDLSTLQNDQLRLKVQSYNEQLEKLNGEVSPDTTKIEKLEKERAAYLEELGKRAQTTENTVKQQNIMVDQAQQGSAALLSPDVAWESGIWED